MHSKHFPWIREIGGLKPDEVVPTHIILHERQASKGSDVVTTRKNGTDRIRVIIWLGVDWRFVLANCDNLRMAHPTEQIGQLPLILEVQWLLLRANLII